MTRSQYEQSIATKRGIIHALKDNLGDEFSALEIAAAMLDPPDLKPMQVSSVLKSMVAEGLVSKRPSKNMNVYRLTKKALTWQPAPYDWRAEGAKTPLPDVDPEPEVAKSPPAAGKVNGTPVNTPPAAPIGQLDPKRQRQPADDHPWIHPPAVTPPKPKAAPITRPLPAHLETKPDPRHSPASPDPGALDLDADDLAAMALPEAPIAPAFGTGAILLANPPFDGSNQPVVDNSNSPEIPDSSPLPIDSREDEPLAQPKITPAAVSGCGGNGTCGGHCANHAHASDLEELAEAQVARLTAQLSELTKKNDCFRWANANLTTQLSDAQSKLADAMADLATSQREQDRLHQRLREQDRQRAEDQNRIDALMDVARPHLAKGKAGEQQGAIMAEALMELLRLALLRIPHPDHYAEIGKMA